KGNPQPLEDGTFVMADVLDEDGDQDNVQAQDLRMVFVRDSPPDVFIRRRSQNDELQVLGIPRISLSLVQQRLEASRTTPSVLTDTLPYEMVIVAVFPPEPVLLAPAILKSRPRDTAVADVESPPSRLGDGTAL